MSLVDCSPYTLDSMGQLCCLWPRYQLKMQASRQFFSELSKKFTVMPFTLRSFEGGIPRRTARGTALAAPLILSLCCRGFFLTFR